MNAIPGRCPGLACAAPLALKTGGGEDVDHLAFGGDGPAHELADGGVDLLRCFPVVAALLVQRGLQGLEKGNVITYRRCLIASGAKGEGTGEFRHHLNPALLAVLLFEDVLLAGRDAGSANAEVRIAKLSQFDI